MPVRKTKPASPPPQGDGSVSPKMGLLLAAVSLILFAYVVSLNAPIGIRIFLALAILVASGEMLSRMRASHRLFYGVYMVRSTFGLKLMDTLSKKFQWFWEGMADWGLVLGFGMLSYFIFKKNVSTRMMVFGVLSILGILIFILPFSVLGLSFVNLQQVTSKIQNPTTTNPASGISYIALALYVLSAMGGFTTYLMVSLLANTISILYAIVLAAVTYLSGHPDYSGLNGSVPGVAPIVPGITIPLFAGVLSLAVLLIVHEFSHGILARIAKVKVTASGLLLIGVIPVGAFVEPDEKVVSKLTPKMQNRISAAGVASNMLLTFVFLIPLLIFYYYVMPIYQHPYVYVQATVPNSPAGGVIPINSTILQWNGYNISSFANFKLATVGDTPNANVSVLTSSGAYLLKANSTGKVGIMVQQGVTMGGGLAGAVALFLYTFFALSFLLNFLIAVVNYVPIPGFDGWRIFNTSFKDERITHWATVLVIVTIFVNILPWIWLL
jgi:membrane-associated protease RseP (regulator of RpoE activity)